MCEDRPKMNFERTEVRGGDSRHYNATSDVGERTPYLILRRIGDDIIANIQYKTQEEIRELVDVNENLGVETKTLQNPTPSNVELFLGGIPGGLIVNRSALIKQLERESC
jgi:hypothetical protein